jgi:hypothetical protein
VFSLVNVKNFAIFIVVYFIFDILVPFGTNTIGHSVIRFFPRRFCFLMLTACFVSYRLDAVFVFGEWITLLTCPHLLYVLRALRFIEELSEFVERREAEILGGSGTSNPIPLLYQSTNLSTSTTGT